MSLPEPVPGLVICMSYLWGDEHAAGEEEGRKDRPCVIAATRIDKQGRTLILALPVTHQPPDTNATAIEIPRKVKGFLGMDNDPSWIILSEANESVWPGSDVRPISRKEKGKFAYGSLPPSTVRPC